LRKARGKPEPGDYARAFEIALRLNAGDETGAKLLLQWMKHRTALLVKELFPQIQKLTLALLEHEKLSGAQVAKILNGST